MLNDKSTFEKIAARYYSYIYFKVILLLDLIHENNPRAEKFNEYKQCFYLWWLVSHVSDGDMILDHLRFKCPSFPFQVYSPVSRLYSGYLSSHHNSIYWVYKYKLCCKISSFKIIRVSTICQTSSNSNDLNINIFHMYFQKTKDS